MSAPFASSFDQMLVWRAVAIALASALADEVCDPTNPAVLAYNHARNGRWDEAAEAAKWALAPRGGEA